MRLQITRPLAPPRAPHRRFLPLPMAMPRASGWYQDEPENCRRGARAFLVVLLHLALLLAVFHRYHLETPAFRIIVAVALVALPVHYLLPFRFKKQWFVAASVLGLGLVCGGGVLAAVTVIGVGLIALARAPIAWPWRAGAMAAAAISLGLARVGIVPLPVPEAAWPVLGSMFMFRMILYLYELKHAEEPEPLGDAACYFFLLPNFCFFLFPVVDYRTFRRGYFAKPVHAIQVDGLRMMVRGTVHLLLYRLIYHEYLIPAEEVHSIPTLLGFLLCNYLLYLRVSGQFHMACGMLQLFGFSLPDTHHNYFLANSFTDYWRRINIYWKDFMVRTVFNPVVFGLKRWRRGAALAVATATVFFVTWILHAYQMFWRRGSWGFSIPDTLFWGILGGLVLLNVQIDARRTPQRARAKNQVGTARQLLIRAVQTAGTFATLTLLWSLWYSPSVAAWLSMFRRALG